MNQNGIRKVGLLVLSLALAVIFVGCSTDSATGPEYNSGVSSTSIFEQQDPARTNPEFEFSFSGRIIDVDADNRIILFDGKEDLPFYVEQEARVVLLPNRTEVPFIVDAGRNSGESRSESSVKAGSQATAYGILKGDNLVVVELLEVWENGVVTETTPYSVDR
jgi:hypothetical protein